MLTARVVIVPLSAALALPAGMLARPQHALQLIALEAASPRDVVDAAGNGQL